MHNLYIEFSLKNEHGTYIEGALIFPYKDEVFYKPVEVRVFGGQLDTMHRKNTGHSAEKYRNSKEDIINSYCKMNGLFAVIKDPFILDIRNHIGLIALSGELLGYSTNRNISLEFTHSKFKGYKVAKLFQNLKSYSGNTVGKLVTLDNMPRAIADVVEYLKILHDENIVTASDKTSLIKLKEIKHEN